MFIRYHLSQDGFFSELNCLMRCYIEHEGRCFPCFDNWNAKYQNGLSDYFDYNPNIFPQSSEFIDIIRPQASFYDFLRASRKWGDIDQELKNLANQLWHPKQYILDLAKPYIDNTYASVHVRLGDKNTEVAVWGYQAWIDIINALRHDTVYCACDDAAFIDWLRLSSSKNVVVIDKPKRNGHLQSDFNALTIEERYIEICYLLAEVEICRHSELHVYRNFSNVDWFINWTKRNGKVLRFARDCDAEDALEQVRRSEFGLAS